MKKKTKIASQKIISPKAYRKIAAPVVHFEIIGKNPKKLRDYFGKLFGWKFNLRAPVASAISEVGKYGFVKPRVGGKSGAGIPGGVGGGKRFDRHALFYVGVPDVEAALQAAEKLGGTRRMGPVKNPRAHLVVGQFTDPEGNLIGLAGPA